jgi:hypothetical protein
MVICNNSNSLIVSHVYCWVLQPLSFQNYLLLLKEDEMVMPVQHAPSPLSLSIHLDMFSMVFVIIYYLL